MAPSPDHLSNHLIERAAALLKASGAPRLPDAPPPGAFMAPDSPGPAPHPNTGRPDDPDSGQAAPVVPAGRPSATLAPAPLAPESLAPAPVSTAIRPPSSGVAQGPTPKLLGQPPVRLQSPILDASSSGTSPLPAPAARTETPALLPSISIETLERGGMVVARAARTRISEEYRIVIGRVLRALREETEGGGAHNVVMVTSARPGEGKSFTALNLAGSIAQHSSEKVLLVDTDAKLHPISTQFGVGDRLGFQDLVADPTLRPESVILGTAIGNLSFLPVGTRSGALSDTSNLHATTPIITMLARRFPKHLIMIDAPPCLSTSDPHTLAPFVGQVVMVVEAERTQRSEVEAAVDLVRVCPNITMLLNKVKLTTSHTFGAYDYYGSYT